MINDIDKHTLELITSEVKRFSSSVIHGGNNESIEDKITNAYADGVVSGYNDAVKQIVEFLQDLHPDRIK